MKKSTIFIGLMLVIVLILFITSQFYKVSDYERAKQRSIKFLDSNINNLQKISDEMMLSKLNESLSYKKVSYRYHKNLNDKEYIIFDIDARGMLGGQYFGIIYCPMDDLLDGDSIEIYDENRETGRGNNIFIKEKIKEKWYFYYDDYDGKVDIKNIN